MGLCGSNLTQDEREELNLSKQIEQAQNQDFDEYRSKIRLLLLGAGESGKSTIFKQMKLLYGAGFDDEELQRWKIAVHANVVDFIQKLVEAVETFGYEDQLGKCAEDADLVMSLSTSQLIDPETAAAIERLWENEAIEAAWARRNEFQIIDSNSVFLDKLEELCAPSYSPSNEDILFARVRTSGIVEENYLIKGVEFVIIDVGGQRNERKKWMHCFEDVNATIFVAALSEYDQQLYEDESQNRMVEALNLFSQTLNSRWLSDVDVILFLNKKDLFMEKIGRKQISEVPEFEDYEGKEYDYDDGVAYFLGKFQACVAESKKKVFSHVTCATDTENVAHVFESCQQIIRDRNLQKAGMTKRK